MQAATDPDVPPAPAPPATRRRAADQPRLQMHPLARMALATSGAFTIGMALGGAHGGRTATLRFRAEHAHRMPARTTDWYFYHRSKNYHAIFGGLREGLRMGARLGFWALGLVWLEHCVDRYRGRADLLSTVVASLSVSGGFSLWNRFPLTTVARTTKQALAFGCVFGGLQDVLALARGQPVGYVDFARRRLRPEVASSEVAR